VKAAIEKMEKIANNPVAQGLKDASGKISFDMMGTALSLNFTFKAPGDVRVAPDEDADPATKQMTAMFARGMQRSLKPMLGIFHDDEYDASLATVDGKQVLSVVAYKDNEEQARSEFTLDANGLIAKGASKTQVQMGPQKREVQSEAEFTWTKVGDLYRLEKIESSQPGGGRGGQGGGMGGQGGGMGGQGGMGGGKIVITFTYTEVEKFAIATAWKTELPGGMAIESKLTDLTVNGKKVEAKEPAPPAKDAKKEDGHTGGEGHDHGGDKGGEKDGK
jgi:hypothetical protein